MDVFGRILCIYPNSTYTSLQITFVLLPLGNVLVSSAHPCCQWTSSLLGLVLVAWG
jgi:hypothetical protein